MDGEVEVRVLRGFEELLKLFFVVEAATEVSFARLIDPVGYVDVDVAFLEGVLQGASDGRVVMADRVSGVSFFHQGPVEGFDVLWL